MRARRFCTLLGAAVAFACCPDAREFTVRGRTLRFRLEIG